MSAVEKYGGFAGAHMHVGPGNPGYVSIEEATRRELERREEYEARQEVRAKRRQDAEVEARRAAERAAAKGKRVCRRTILGSSRTGNGESHRTVSDCPRLQSHRFIAPRTMTTSQQYAVQ